MADGIATYCYYCFVMADVISQCQRVKPHIFIVVIAGVITQWQMEWPLQGGSDLSPGRCCSQGADGSS